MIVVAGLIKKDNKILIAKRASHKILGGFWEFPGGKVNKNEELSNALIREIKEELDINIEVLNQILSWEFQYDFSKIKFYAFYANFLEGNIKLIDHMEVKWVDKNEFKDYDFVPADIKLIDYIYKENL